MLKPLTDRQREVVDAIRRSIREHGYPPTLKELCTVLRLRSTHGVFQHLKLIEAKGYITRAPLISRGIQITDNERDPT